MLDFFIREAESLT